MIIKMRTMVIYGNVKLIEGGMREFSKVIKMFCTLIEALVTRVCTFVKTNQIILLISVHFTVCKFYPNFKNL